MDSQIMHNKIRIMVSSFCETFLLLIPLSLNFIFSIALTEWIPSMSFLISRKYMKVFSYKAFLELFYHILTSTSSMLFCIYMWFFPVFIVLGIHHLKQSFWIIKNFFFPLFTPYPLFLTHCWLLNEM